MGALQSETFAAVEPYLPKQGDRYDRTRHPDVNTTSASKGPANQPVHRQGQHVDSVDQLSSITLLGLAVIGAVAADLLLWLVF